MDRWDILLLAVAGYVAVLSLVRLMARRRSELVKQVRAQIVQHRERKPNAPPASEAEPPDQSAAS